MKIFRSPFVILLIALCLILMLPARQATANSVKASTFGYNPEDASSAFLQALKSPYDTIVFDLQSKAWNVGPNLITDLSNKVLIFEKGVVLKALPKAFPNEGDCLLKLVRGKNITIIGYGATFAMNKPEYKSGEHRMGIALTNCSGIVIKGLVIRDTGGDGVYVTGEGSETDPSSVYSKDILLEDLKLINNRRQGMSIISVQNMIVRYCLFTQTNGTLPESGMDIEPNSNNQRIVNLRFEHCSFTNNYHSGIQLSMNNLDTLTVPISITFSDCYLSNNHAPTNQYTACEIEIGCRFGNPVKGEVLFERCLVENSQWRAIYSRKTSNAFHVTFKDCVFKDICQLQSDYNNPIFLEVPNYSKASPALGGFTFDNVLITYNTNFPFFRVFGERTLKGLADIDGKFTIVEPFGNGVLYQKVPDTTNVTFTYITKYTLPPTEVNLISNNNQAAECTGKAATFTASRKSKDISYPLPVKYNTNPAATLGDDVHLMTGAIIIPANKTAATDSVFARKDYTEESPEKIPVKLLQSTLYNVGNARSVEINVIDCLVSKSKNK